MALMLFFLSENSFSQTIGTYPDKTIISGQNTTITPSVPPTGADYLFAFTQVSFSGVLSANPTTGVVSVTNALLPGSYLVIVKAFGADTISSKFTLTVTNPYCSNAQFYDNGNLGPLYGPVALGIADFNKDGNQDFVVSDKSAPTYSIGFGNGRGVFSGYNNPYCSSGCQYFNPQTGMGISDLNGDGHVDLVLNRWEMFFGHTYPIIWGEKSPETKMPAYSYFSESKVFEEIGDFNNDGFPDMVTTDYPKRTTVYIVFGNVAGKPIPGKEIKADTTVLTIRKGDFNGDGNQDIALLISGLKKIAIKLGDGLGGFSNSADVVFDNESYNLHIGDFNSDGKQDIAITNRSNSLSIRQGDGLGGFTGNTEVALVSGFGKIAFSDFNGDGKLDLALVH